MKTQKFALLIALFSLFTLASCNKDKDPKAASKTDMISSGAGKKWKISSMLLTYKAGGQTFTEDLMDDDYMDDCDKDDVLIFFSNKKLESRAGATKCNTSDPDLMGEGTWTFNSTETQITMIEDGRSQTYDIKELTGNTLKGEQTATQDGVTGTLSITFTAL